MSFEQSKIYFKKLKEVCKNIDSSVSEIKRKLNEVPEDDASYAAAKCITDIQDRILKLKSEANELKYKLEPNLDHTTVFVQHFKELTVDTDISVTNLENYLKQYGYTPLNVTVSSAPPEKSDVTPVKNECHLYAEDPSVSKTPNLLDYGIASYECSSSVSQFKGRKSSFEDLAVPPMIELKGLAKDKENSGSTPTLEINFVPHTEEETPPLSESLRIVPQFPSTPKLEL